jgi:flagellar basal body-associated protein FliL
MANTAENAFAHKVRRWIIISIILVLAIVAAIWIIMASGHPDTTVVTHSPSPGASNPGAHEGNDSRSTSNPTTPTGSNSGGSGVVPVNP